MKTRILAIILFVCLVGALAWGFISYNQIGELKLANLQLQNIISEQNRVLNQIRGEYELVRQRYLECDQRNYELEQEVDYLEEGLQYCGEANDRLERQVASLSESLDEWETAYNDLLANYNQLTEQMKDVDYLQYLLQLLL